MDIEFKYAPMTATAARRWHNRYTGGKFPAWQSWVYVTDLQFYPARPCFLIAGENGLCGIVSIGMRRAAARSEVA